MILQQTSRGIRTNFAYHSFRESITKKAGFDKKSSNRFTRLKNFNLHVWRFKLTSVWKTSETMSLQILWKTSCPIFVLSLFSGSCQKKNERKKKKSREESFLQREKNVKARKSWCKRRLINCTVCPAFHVWFHTSKRKGKQTRLNSSRWFDS